MEGKLENARISSPGQGAAFMSEVKEPHPRSKTLSDLSDLSDKEVTLSDFCVEVGIYYIISWRI